MSWRGACGCYVPQALRFVLRAAYWRSRWGWGRGGYKANLLGVPVGEKKYTRDHEWIELDADGKTGAFPPPFDRSPNAPAPSQPVSTPPLSALLEKLTYPPGTIGITTYASKALGDVVYVELPTPDTPVTAGDVIGAVESVKSASDILTPVSGTIIEANGVLEERPGTINKGPEGEGWIARIEVEDKGEVESLMGKEEYVKFTED